MIFCQWCQEDYKKEVTAYYFAETNKQFLCLFHADQAANFYSRNVIDLESKQQISGAELFELLQATSPAEELGQGLRSDDIDGLS